MPARYLFGPSIPEVADGRLRRHRQQGLCLTFDHDGKADLKLSVADSWDDLRGRLPQGWEPDFAILDLAYQTIPPCLWSAPLPLVGLARDVDLLWHGYAHTLPACDLVLAQATAVELLARAGLRHARAANLAAPAPPLAEAVPDGVRDIDVLFLLGARPLVQREKLPWLARAARLGDRWRVALGPDGDRALLQRARIALDTSAWGECGTAAFEAAAAGALPFQERGNRELPEYLRDRKECIYYGPDDLEGLLEHYLGREDERRALAEAARVRSGQFSAAVLWEATLGIVEHERPALHERVRQRQDRTPAIPLPARLWQALGSAEPRDAALPGALAQALAAQPRDASLHNALGLASALFPQPRPPSLAALAGRVVAHFRRAVECDPAHAVARLNLVEALATAERLPEAVAAAREALAVLDHVPLLSLRGLHEGHFPPVPGLFRGEWERAAWSQAGNPAGAARLKRDLLRWRLHCILGELANELPHRYEAVVARPDLALTRAALGCALARGGRPQQALEHLRHAVAAAPLDRDAARALAHALEDTGDERGRRLLARDRRLLSRAAPQAVPPED